MRLACAILLFVGARAAGVAPAETLVVRLRVQGRLDVLRRLARGPRHHDRRNYVPRREEGPARAVAVAQCRVRRDRHAPRHAGRENGVGWGAAVAAPKAGDALHRRAQTAAGDAGRPSLTPVLTPGIPDLRRGGRQAMKHNDHESRSVPILCPAVQKGASQ